VSLIQSQNSATQLSLPSTHNPHKSLIAPSCRCKDATTFFSGSCWGWRSRKVGSFVVSFVRSLLCRLIRWLVCWSVGRLIRWLADYLMAPYIPMPRPPDYIRSAPTLSGNSTAFADPRCVLELGPSLLFHTRATVSSSLLYSASPTVDWRRPANDMICRLVLSDFVSGSSLQLIAVIHTVYIGCNPHL
jgi:hypothetical protein